MRVASLSLFVTSCMIAPLLPRSCRWNQAFSHALTLKYKSTSHLASSLLRHTSTSTTRRTMSSNSNFNNNNDSSLFWNREWSKPLDFSQHPIQQKARILSLSNPDDPDCRALHQAPEELPGVETLKILGHDEPLDLAQLEQEDYNVLFVSPGPVRDTVAQLVAQLPTLQWVHCRSAGIDFVTSPALSAFSGTTNAGRKVTNAKGTFSSTLAEYTLLACGYFAKDLPRLLRNKKAKNWDRYQIEELRGKVLGIVGFGDIGRACARLAKAYGMKVIAIRRNANASKQDPLCDAMYPRAELNRLMAESDYIVCAAPLTEETKHMFGKEQFDAISKPHHAVFINVGRGPICDETALIEALQNGQLRGAGLDVVVNEPLPSSSPLWELDNVLLSPHNMDMTKSFMAEATEFFVNENLPRFVRKLPVLNPVNPANGY